MSNGSFASTVTAWVDRLIVQEKKDGPKLIIIIIIIGIAEIKNVHIPHLNPFKGMLVQLIQPL